MSGLRFCPNCGSTKVEPDTSIQAEIAITGGNPNKWMCNECGFTGFMPEMNEEDYENEAPEIEFSESDNLDDGWEWFGRGYFSYIKYIELPAIIAVAAYILYRLLIQR